MATRAPVPALLTGTSSEFLGRRPLPHVVRRRLATVILGPEGSGKTTVAMRLVGSGVLRLDTRAVQAALVERVSMRGWAHELREAPALVLDGPVWLHNRPAAVDCLAELVRHRIAQGKRTAICQSDCDGSAHLLIEPIGLGQVVLVGLRYPKGRRGRKRFAARCCDELGLPRLAARGTEAIDDWSYESVLRYLARWKKQNPQLF